VKRKSAAVIDFRFTHASQIVLPNQKYIAQTERGRNMKKIGIVLALIFAMNFGGLVFAQNTNSSTTTSTTTTTTRRVGSSSRRRRMRRRALRRRRHRRGSRANGNMQNGNGNTQR
jgi:hypothetical protein